MTTGNDRWQLESVEMRGFLGANDEGVRVDVDRPVVVLTGPNGSGKSTLLTAIEWTLFGEASYAPGPDAGVSGRGHDKFRVFINEGCDECSVTLRFTRDGSELVWTRKRTRSAPTDDEVTVEIDGESAADDPPAHFGFDHDVFRRSVGPRQGALAALVLSEDTDRDEALNRILGIDRLDAAVIGFTRAERNVKRELDDLSDALQGIVAPLRDDARRAFDRRREARDRALEEDVPAGQIDLDGGRQIIERAESEVETSVTTTITDHKDLRSAADDLESAAKEAFKGAAPHRRHQRLTDLKEQISGLRDTWQQAITDRQEAAEELEDLVEEHGSIEDRRNALESASVAKEEAETALAEANVQADILRRAQRWLEHQTEDVTDLDCPVCTRGIAAEELTTVVTGTLEKISGADGRIQELRRDIERASERVDAIKAALKDLEAAAEKAQKTKTAVLDRYTELAHRIATAHDEFAARTDRDEVEDRIKQGLHDLSEEIPEPADDGVEMTADVDAVDEALRSFLFEALQEAIEETSDQIDEAETRISRVRSQILKIRSIADVLAAHAELSELDDLLGTDEIARAQAAVATAHGDLGVVEKVAGIAEGIAESEIEDIVAAVRPLVDRWFGALSSHDVLTRARIDGEIKASGQRRSIRYFVRATTEDGSWVAAPGPHLSGGYQMLLGVALLLALSEHQASESNLSLLALDEIHGLDPEAERQLLETLGSNSPAERTIVTTTDEEQAQPLVDAAGAARSRIIRFQKWTDDDGIRVGS